MVPGRRDRRPSVDGPRSNTVPRPASERGHDGMTDIPNDPMQPPGTPPPPPPPPPPDPWGQASPPPGPQRSSSGTNGSAVTSLVLGSLQCFSVPLIGAVLARVCGCIVRHQ